MSYNQEEGKTFIQNLFDTSAVPSLSEFVTIPNLSLQQDKAYKSNGFVQKAGFHIQSWIQGLGIKGIKTQFIQPEDLSPLLFVQIQGQLKNHTTLFYGHFDKQGQISEWKDNKQPTTAVLQNSKLYGRGVANNGFSPYAYMLAVKAVQQQNVPLPRILMLLESGKESKDIQTYLERIKQRIGQVDTIFAFDSEVADFEKCWLSKSTRGALSFTLKIKILKDGVHSGDSSGIVPSAFKIANLLLDRLENLETGEINSFFQKNIPSDRYCEFWEASQQLKLGQLDHLKLVPGIQAASNSQLDVLINKGWKPTLTVTGITGFPPVSSAGNVMLPQISFRISMKLPPTLQKQGTEEFLKKLLTTNTPFESTISVEDFAFSAGWNAAPLEPWLQTVIQSSSQKIYESKAYSLSQGGSIPAVTCLSALYPKASIVVSGALGPNSNGLGPNQNLDLPYTVKLTRFLASVLALSSGHYQSEAK